MKTEEEEKYAGTWQYIRKWEIRLGGVFLLCPLIVTLNFLLPGEIYAANVVALIIGIGVCVVASRIRPMCPRCGKEFFRDALLRDGTWKNKCVHCGLPKGALSDPDRHT